MISVFLCNVGRVLVVLCIVISLSYLFIMARVKKQQEYSFTAPLEEVSWQFMNTIIRVPDSVVEGVAGGAGADRGDIQ